MEDVLFLVGRTLVVALPIYAGATSHFKEEAVEYARASGVPVPHLAVPLSGIVFVLGGISVILGLWADVGALLVAVTLVTITVYMHPYWKFAGEERAGHNINFWKNTGMIGGQLLVAWGYAEGADLPLSLTDGLA